MKVLVIGAGGFVGSATTRALLRSGCAVRCMVRPSSCRARLVDLPVEWCVGDLTQPATLPPALDGCDAVVHLASPSAWSEIRSPALQATVVGGTTHLLKVLGARRMVFVSSAAAVNGSSRVRRFDEDSPCALPTGLVYAHAKRRAEDACRRAARSGAHVVIVNPAEVYGPDDTSMITAGNLVDFAHSRPVFVPRGGTAIVHVDDVAAGIVAALTHGLPGHRYILAGDNLSLRHLARTTLSLLGRSTPILLLPNDLLRGVARWGSALGLPLPFEPEVIPYATLHWYVSNRKARAQLGVRFRGARDVLAPTVQWLQATGRL